MADIKILDDALDHIRKYPRRHNQSSFFSGRQGCGLYYNDMVPVAASNGDSPPCGTTLCFAGWISFLNAPEGSTLEFGGKSVSIPGRGRVDIDDYAEEVAGLSHEQAGAMFFGAATFGHLVRMIGQVKADADADGEALLTAAGLLI
jgi:hypothetical protein